MRFRRAAFAAFAALALRCAAGESFVVFFADLFFFAAGFLADAALGFFAADEELDSCAVKNGGREITVIAESANRPAKQKLFKDTLIVYF
jgi:hypothetical protein